ncbi:hypothetical protein KIPB_012220, partial [Kipferlia bialata]
TPRTGGHLTLALPREADSDRLHVFLQQVENAAKREPELIREWGLRQTTLEEVFLAISRHAEAQNRMKMIRRVQGNLGVGPEPVTDAI